MNGKILLVLILGASFLFFGCVQEQAPEEPVTPPVTPPPAEEEPMPGSDRDEHGCIGSAGYTWCEAKQKCLREWEEPCEEEPEEEGLTEAEAKAIALNSSCMDEGNLTDDAPMYNNVTQTWWFETDIVKDGCMPACVVDEATKTAEINWRCTGLIPPEENETGDNETSGLSEEDLADLFQVDTDEPVGDEGLGTDTPTANSS